MGGTDVSQKYLHSIPSIRDKLEVHGEKPLVKGMVELNDDRADNSEEAEVKVDTSAV